MLFPLVTWAVSGLLCSTLTHGSTVPYSHDKRNNIQTDSGAPRHKALLLDIPGLPKLPKIRNAGRVAAVVSSSIPLDDIQGDILIGMKKPIELFLFFVITDVDTFKSGFNQSVLQLITSTSQILAADPSDQPDSLVNVAFSGSGLTTLGVDKDSLRDSSFSSGQFAEAYSLGDPGTDNWVESFKGVETHGVFLIASDSMDRLETTLETITRALGDSIQETHRVQGAARPGSEAGHEHFGFLDGISQPVITGFNDGPATLGDGTLIAIPPGVILTGLDGDAFGRPSWAKGGSFLVFRQLKQLVPEFNKFLLDNPTDGSSELTGARMVGRWKSGAPIDLVPTADDPQLGVDSSRNNLFNFSHPEIPNYDINSDQIHCPFSAHIRKVRPRGDEPFNTQNQMIRASIPYGPEVTDEEKDSNTTSTERGLAFVAYQSTIVHGFGFQQVGWANNKAFPTGKSDPAPGFDPIIGQNHGQERYADGIDPKDPSKNITLIIDFVQSRGGEYFFSPPISALSSTILA